MTAKKSNQFGIDHAYPGICSLCFIEIGVWEGSDKSGMPKLVSFKGNARTISVVLDDNSKMTVRVCIDCERDISDKDMKDLMKSELAGWQCEIDTKLKDKWTQKQKDKYMKEYSMKKINKIEKEKKYVNNN